MAGVPQFHASVSDTLVSVCTGPCYITGGWAFAAGAAQGFVQMFDALAADVTLGTTLPDYVVPVSPGDNDAITQGQKLLFKVGCVIACTTTTTGSTGRACDISIAVE